MVRLEEVFVNHHKIQKLKAEPQGTTKWLNARYRKISSSIAAKILQKSVDFRRILEPDGNYSGTTVQFTYEKALKLLLTGYIFDTELWIHRRANWLCSSPDGFIFNQQELTVVEIKVISSKKSMKSVLTEYYHQFQLEILLTDTQFCIVIVIWPETELIEMVKLVRDIKYIEQITKKLESTYFKLALPEIFSETYPSWSQEVFENIKIAKQYLVFNKDKSELDQSIDIKVRGNPKFDPFMFPKKLLKTIEHMSLEKARLLSSEFLKKSKNINWANVMVKEEHIETQLEKANLEKIFEKTKSILMKMKDRIKYQ